MREEDSEIRVNGDCSPSADVSWVPRSHVTASEIDALVLGLGPSMNVLQGYLASGLASQVAQFNAVGEQQRQGMVALVSAVDAAWRARGRGRRHRDRSHAAAQATFNVDLDTKDDSGDKSDDAVYKAMKLAEQRVADAELNERE